MPLFLGIHQALHVCLSRLLFVEGNGREKIKVRTLVPERANGETLPRLFRMTQKACCPTTLLFHKALLARPPARAHTISHVCIAGYAHSRRIPAAYPPFLVLHCEEKQTEFRRKDCCHLTRVNLLQTTCLFVCSPLAIGTLHLALPLSLDCSFHPHAHASTSLSLCVCLPFSLALTLSRCYYAKLDHVHFGAVD